ncbi:MAG: IS1380 family transposase [Desulfomonilaceae bacterium]|nr:IS1380 family transposase [Desulfomonilaceae bacterium]
MKQGLFPFKYEVQKKSGGMTAMAGLLPYLEFGYVMGLSRAVENRLKIRPEQGWSDAETIMSLIYLNLADGQGLSDLDILEADEGFCRVLRKSVGFGKSRRERRGLEKRMRKGQSRSVPSPSSSGRYLSNFHDPEQEKLRPEEGSFIPAPNEHLKALIGVTGDFVGSVQRRSPQEVATLDLDATVVETNKREALYCYKGHKAYQPLQVYWAEQDLILHSEFRDGNVWAGTDNVRVLSEGLGMLPGGVSKVYLRTDTAGYQHDLMEFCADPHKPRFGVIDFCIGAKVTESFKQAVSEVEEPEWSRLWRKTEDGLVDSGQEYAEVCFVPAEMARKKNAPTFRYLAIREPLEQPALPDLDDQPSLPFPTMNFGSVKHKVFGLVTNRDLPGDELIWWHRERCGKSEEAHSIMKEDLAGGRLPSGNFGVNAAWWHIMILALNLNSAMKRLVLGGTWVGKRMKAIRFRLIKLPARVLYGARTLKVRLVGGHPSNDTLFQMRRRILSFCDSG